MSIVNLITGLLCDSFLWPFGRPWTALVAAALATAALMLLIIRGTSSPSAIRRAKDRLTARVLELVLFRHDALVSFTAAGRILAANLAYLRTLSRPLACSIIPCFLILAQLSCWFAARPLRVGEATLIEVKVRDGTSVMERPIFLSGANAVRVESDALRIPRLSEIDWRLRAERPGLDWIEIHVGDEAAVRKQIVVGDAFQKVSQRRSDLGLWDHFWHPAEAPIDSDHSIVQVDVRYPARLLELGNLEVDWIVAFVGLTMLFGLILKRPMRVRF